MAAKRITNRGTVDRRGLSSVTHGQTTLDHDRRTDEYVIWTNMKQRCLNPKNTAYHNYGGRGIVVCERWVHSFQNFLSDMGLRPTKQHEIERCNNELGYSPENCVWATSDRQSRNRRSSHFLEHDGKRMILGDWASLIGISRKTLTTRLRDGWSVERALTQKLWLNAGKTHPAKIVRQSVTS